MLSKPMRLSLIRAYKLNIILMKMFNLMLNKILIVKNILF